MCRERRVVEVSLPHDQSPQDTLTFVGVRAHAAQITLQVRKTEEDVVIAERKEPRALKESRSDAQPLKIFARATVNSLRHIQKDHISFSIGLLQNA